MEEALVKLSVTTGEEIIQLSTLDQQAQRNYANLLLVFALDKEASINDVLQNIKCGLETALCGIPDFASVVAPLLGSTRKELELRLGPDSAVPLRIVNHAAAVVATKRCASPLAGRTYTDLARDSFPLATIPREFLFVPQPSCEESCPHGLPALLVQINLIEGGVIMGISWHHTVCDAKGMNTFLRSWAHHSETSSIQGAVSIPTNPSEQTRDRWRLAYGHRDVSITQFTGYQVDSAVRAPVSSVTPHLLDCPDLTAATTTLSTWYFSSEALQSLRNVLGSAASEDGNMVQFTNSEAVSALIWKHLSRARVLHRSHYDTSLFSTRVDFRARAKPAFHDDYIGNINEPNAQTRMHLRDVCSESTPQSLVALAKAIRDAVGSMDDKAMREFIGLVEGLPAVTDLAWDYDPLPGPDLVVTDTSGLDMLHHSWGGALGHPTCIRSGSREKGAAYILPQDRVGGFEVQLQCESEAVDRLRANDVFTRYAQFRC